MAFSHGLRWCVLWMILVSAINVHRTTVLARKIAHKVELCPKNTKEWQIASRRLNCTNDISNPKNRYHCLPANDLSTLVEFCYDETRLGVVKGSCMLYVQRINYLDDYNCSGFRDGCPDKMYFSDESYLFPRCSEIIPKRLCFVAESSCKGNASGNLQTSHPASTQPSKRKDNALAWSISLAIALLLVVIVFVIICNWKKGACQNRLETFCANSSESPTTARSQSSGVANEKKPFLAIDKSDINEVPGSATRSNESIQKDTHSISDQTMSATIEENKTDKKEDKQSTSNKDKLKDVCIIPERRFDSQTKSNKIDINEASGSATASNESIQKDMHSISDQTMSATIEENKTDKKEDKQSTSDKDKLKDVCVIPEQRFDSQTKSDKIDINEVSGSATASNESIQKDMHSISDQTMSATIEENKTDKKEDKQSTSDKDKLKDVCVIPEQRFDSQTKSDKIDINEVSGSATASNESIQKDMHSISDQTMSATIEENKTDKKEDKQSTSDKDKLKDVCVIPEQRFDSQTKSDRCLLDLIKEWPEILISNVGKEEPVDEVAHISRVTSNFICLDNKQWVVKIDHKGNILGKHELGDFWGSASSTVDENGDLLIIRQNNKVVKVKSNKEEPIEVLSVDRRWSILSVHFSRFSGEILLRIYLQKWNKYSTHIVRYNKDREKSLEFEYHKHDKLIVYPLFLSENVNHDICIADNYDCRVIAFDKKGIEKYIYKGPLPDYNFSPTGLCNDKRGHVLVCNCHESNPSVHLLNIKGMLLSIIIDGRPDVKEPWGLCVDDNGKFYLGQKKCDVIKVFQYLKKS